MLKEVQKLRRVYSSDKGKHVAVELENITRMKNDTRKRSLGYGEENGKKEANETDI